MKHYKKQDGTIRAIGEETDIDGDQSFLVQEDWILLSDEEFQIELKVREVPISINSITNSQLRQQLLSMGVYEEVDSIIMNGTNIALKIKWEYDQNFLITDADLIAMYDMLKRIETLQELFNEASKL